MPLPAERLIRYERLVVPDEHLGVLIEPAPAVVHGLLRTSPAASAADTPFLDTTLGALHRALCERLRLTPPVIVAGHQPDFYHAGVFAKVIAAHALAASHRGQAVFLTVDSDVPKTTRVAIPQATASSLRRVDVPIPGCEPQRPFEAQPRVPRVIWLQFFASLSALYEFHDRSLLPTYARAWLTTADASPSYCAAFDRAQQAAENALGLTGGREFRMSELCTTPEFRTFAAYLLLNAPRVVETYNAARTDYRRRHRVHAPGRPVPPLAVRDGRYEVPLWIHRIDEPRRRLFVAPCEQRIDLFAEDTPVADLPSAALRSTATHAAPWALEEQGWQLRPRALTLSAFARLFLADLFIHGIGGAKYDEMMEDFITALLGLPPPPACCVSATAYLPLPHAGIGAADIVAARHRGRDLRYNPQCYIHNLPAELLRQRAELVRRSSELRAHQSRDHAARSLVFQALRRLNEQMLQTDPWRVAEYDQRVQALETQAQADRIAHDRAYFYALLPQETLEQLVAAVRRALTP